MGPFRRPGAARAQDRPLRGTQEATERGGRGRKPPADALRGPPSEARQSARPTQTKAGQTAKRRAERNRWPNRPPRRGHTGHEAGAEGVRGGPLLGAAHSQRDSKGLGEWRRRAQALSGRSPWPANRRAAVPHALVAALVRLTLGPVSADISPCALALPSPSLTPDDAHPALKQPFAFPTPPFPLAHAFLTLPP